MERKEQRERGRKEEKRKGKEEGRNSFHLFLSSLGSVSIHMQMTHMFWGPGIWSIHSLMQDTFIYTTYIYQVPGTVLFEFSQQTYGVDAFIIVILPNG